MTMALTVTGSPAPCSYFVLRNRWNARVSAQHSAAVSEQPACQTNSCPPTYTSALLLVMWRRDERPGEPLDAHPAEAPSSNTPSTEPAATTFLPTREVMRAVKPHKRNIARLPERI